MVKEAININEITSSFRFNPSFHLSKSKTFERLLSNFELIPLKKLSIDIFTAGRSKRSYSGSKNGIPFLGNTNITSINPHEGCQYVSQRFWKDTKSFLREGMILTGRVGQNTVGSYTYSSKIFEGSIGSDNVIRIIPNQKVKTGYLFCYLASKYGFEFSRKHISGNAQPFITEEMIGTIPVPIISLEKQDEIHHYVTQSAELRVKANGLLKESIDFFESLIGKTNISLNNQAAKIKINRITSFLTRLDSQYHIITQKLEQEKNVSFKYDKISSFARRIFVGNRGKRNYVENGIPFLSSSDMLLFNPKRFAKQVSSRTQSLESLKVKLKDILISRSGTVGNVIMVGRDLVNSAVSEHAIRLEIDEKLMPSEYIFCFLKTKVGKLYMEASAFGSVIITLNEEMIGNIPIPIMNEEDRNAIVSNVKKYQDLLDEATNAETQAIQLVEKEIEQWQS